MTAMLASVTGPEEAEIAIAGGADIIDLKDSRSGSLGALPVATIAAAVAAVGGRRATSAVTGDLPMQPERVKAAVAEVAASGVDYVKIGLFPEEGRPETVAALVDLASETRLVGVLFADRETDPLGLLRHLALAGFAGIMLDTADKAGGRLLVHADIASLARFGKAAHAEGLLVGFAGGLEEPDVPRLLALGADFLGFRGALCAARDRRAGIEIAAVQAIRRLIPRAAPDGEPANVDYRLLSARGYHPDSAERDGAAQRVYVRDFVLPVRIGAYSHERAAPQNVRFDVTVDVQRPRAAPQGMGEVFSYDLITDGISALVAEGHVDFVETLAERIAALVLRDPRARRVTVKVEKLDMGPGGVGVEIAMERPDGAAQMNPVLAMLEDSRRKPRP